MIKASRSKVHLRLVKKLPGQPPSGAIVPCTAPGELPRFMKQAPPLAAASFQRPARSTGGGDGAGGGGGAALACGSGRAATRSLPVHPLSATAPSIAATIAAAIFAACARSKRISSDQLIRDPPNLKRGRKRSPKALFRPEGQKRFSGRHHAPLAPIFLTEINPIGTSVSREARHDERLAERRRWSVGAIGGRCPLRARPR